MKPASRYSLLSLLKHGLRGHRHWPPAWRSPEPRRSYDVVIVGGGGHGLATAYYLARHHGVRDIAVLERGWIGGGNAGRNTTIVRSNYVLPENAKFLAHSLGMWEGLSQELNFNVMFSQRGVVNVLHSMAEMNVWAARYNGLRMLGSAGEILSVDELARMVPALNCSSNARMPIVGGFIQRTGGVARHDAVVWGYARAADALGVDIIQNCEVTGFDIRDGRVAAVETSLGRIGAGRVAISVSGSSSLVAQKAGLQLPIESHLLQALVSEPVKPFLDVVVSSSANAYVSQTDKGEILIGGPLDGYNSYSQRGRLSTTEHIITGALEMFPGLRQLRWMRQWAGVVDMSMDGSPILSMTQTKGLYFSGGWCYGGFKATPAAGWCMAHMVANDQPHPLNAPYSLERFRTGAVLNERGRGPNPAIH